MVVLRWAVTSYNYKANQSWKMKCNTPKLDEKYLKKKQAI